MAIALKTGRPLGAVVIGRAGMDLYPLPDGAKIETADSFRADVGGSGGNIAVALARLGAPVALLAPLADDPVGRFTRARLAAHGVDISRARAVGGEARNTLALAETRAEGCEVVIYRNGAADFELSSADIDAARLHEATALVVTGTALAREPSRGAAMKALASAKFDGCFAVLDLDHRAYSWGSEAEAQGALSEAARLADAVVGNEEEFALLAGDPAGAAGRAEIASQGRAFAILKKGAAGSTTFCDGASFETPAFEIEIAKPFGAGDAFLGGLLAALMAGAPLEEAVRRGAAGAALVVSRPGCASAMPDGAAIDAFLAERS